ncbi:hypothetical protein BDN72DRAFT_856476 [Pluteus cervinus]|uniref:Uncharacterized protein n=1 Tax=Pluteus cervinus TaxID=181527 RepID=A0ACD3B0C3_9AGAR|nr:hypothetical protein BDN72DRAFT_856476 [Pluteus cervinus]
MPFRGRSVNETLKSIRVRSRIWESWRTARVRKARTRVVIPTYRFFQHHLLTNLAIEHKACAPLRTQTVRIHPSTLAVAKDFGAITRPYFRPKFLHKIWGQALQLVRLRILSCSISFRVPSLSIIVAWCGLNLGIANGYCQRYVSKSVEAAANSQKDYYRNGTYPDQWAWLSALSVFYLRELGELTGLWDYGNVINTVFNGWESRLDNGGSYHDVSWVVVAYNQAGRGGGVFWSSARDYKNAISITLPPLAIYTIALPFRNPRKPEEHWLKSTKMRGDDASLTRDGSCDNNGETQWTYNQGALLPGLGYLYKYTRDDSVIQDARLIEASMARLTVNGYLRESCESETGNNCNSDQQAFTGILTIYSMIRQQADGILRYAAGRHPDGIAIYGSDQSERIAKSSFCFGRTVVCD